MKRKRRKLGTLKPAIREITSKVSPLQSKGSALGLAQRRFYDSRLWERVRAAKLARDPLCQRCKALGRVTAAVHVDHRESMARGGHQTADENLASLCASCHSQKTQTELNGLPLPENAPNAPRGLGFA